MSETRKTKKRASSKDYIVIPKALRNALKAVRGSGEIESRASFANLCPISRAVIREKYLKAAIEQRPEIGQKIKGEGIFLGQYRPKDRKGRSLGKTFNVFAMPKDLSYKNGRKALLDFNKTVQFISELKNRYGHNGGNYVSDTQLYQALEDGSYQGEWVIPTRELLHGVDMNGQNAQLDNLLSYQNEGSFAGSFTVKDYGPHIPCMYWSCSEIWNDTDRVCAIRFPGGYGTVVEKTWFRMSCRPVRLVEVTQPDCR